MRLAGRGRKRCEPPCRRLEPRRRCRGAAQPRRPGGGVLRGAAGARRSVVRLERRVARRAVDAPHCHSASGVDLRAPSTSTQHDYEDYYVGFANGALWPLLHYFGSTSCTTRDAHYDGLSARQSDASRETLAPLLKPDDIVWVHDYHLIPLGASVRERGRHQPHRLLPAHSVPAARVLLALPRHE